jgi:hypothetical protein
MKYQIVTFVLIILLIVSCDPGWRYRLADSELLNHSQRYNLELKNLNLNIYAYDFGYQTRIEIQISTNHDSTVIFPHISSIYSALFKKVHLPNKVHISIHKQDSLILDKLYTITSTVDTMDKQIITPDIWDSNDILIKEWNYINRITHTNLNKSEYLVSYIVNKGDKVSIIFNYLTFVYYKRNIFWGSHKGADFEFKFDIFNDNQPLRLSFVAYK